MYQRQPKEVHAPPALTGDETEKGLLRAILEVLIRIHNQAYGDAVIYNPLRITLAAGASQLVDNVIKPQAWHISVENQAAPVMAALEIHGGDYVGNAPLAVLGTGDEATLPATSARIMLNALVAVSFTIIAMSGNQAQVIRS